MKNLFFILSLAFTSLFSAESAIASFNLPRKLTIDNAPLYLHQKLTPLSTITTPAGRACFKLTQNGIQVSQPGLYRVNFYQACYSVSDSSLVTITLRRLMGSSVHSDRRIKYCSIAKNNELEEMSFSQIIALNAKDSIQIIISPSPGKITLANGVKFSGLTIEAL